MRQPTIAERRYAEVEKLAEMCIKDIPDDEKLTQAKALMNSFYRLCGIDERLVYLENDWRTVNSPYTKKLAEQSYNRYQKLKKRFEDFCGLTLFYNSWLPSIGTKDPVTGSVCQKISRYFYE